MGIDKSNIRWVIHYNMPQSIENYYQEIGRAGRDGEQSECILLFSPGDIHTQKYLVEVGIENAARKQVQYKKLQQMVDLVYSNMCYRKSILAYFGEDVNNDCNNCSNCLNEGEIIDKTLDAQKVISCIARMKRSYGTTMIVDVLRGSKNKKVIDQGFNTLTTYGIMKNYSNDELKTFINTLVSHGFLDIVENLGMRGSFPTVKLNEQSMKVIKNEIKVEFKEDKVSKSSYVANELYDKLIELRSEISKEESIAPYMVFSDATLRAMASVYPTSKEEMLSVSGVGEIKYQKYGISFEEIIEEYVKENNINKEEIIEKLKDNHKTTATDSEYFHVNTDKNLYQTLREYRTKIAKEERVPPFKILASNTLKEISGRYPQDEDQLKDIGGIGPVKVNKYGETILNIVKEYITENNIKPKWEDKKKLKLILDGDNRKNEEIALDLLNQGKSIEDVSEELEVSLSTILGYVYDYIKENNKLNFNLDLKSLYDDNEKNMILDAIERFGEEKVSVVKKALPDHIKYESIRAIILEKYI